MKNWHHVFVKGTKEEDITQASHALHHGQLFCVCEVSSETHMDELKSSLKDVGDDFSLGMRDFIHMHRPSSLAAVEFKNNQVYVYCHNATVLLKRGENFFKIARGIKETSGITQNDDVFFVMTNSFDISTINTKELTHELLTQHCESTGGGAIVISHTPHESTHEEVMPIESVFARPRHKEEVVQEEPDAEPSLGFSIESSHSPSPHKKLDVVFNLFSQHKKNILRGGFLLVFLGLLLWGFAFASAFIESKKQEGLQKRLSALRPEIEELQQNPFKNTGATISRLNEMQQEVNKLEKQFPKSREDITELSRSIAIIKKEVGNGKTTEEKVFFDLDLIDEDIEATMMEVGTDSVTLLDKDNKKAYQLSIENKNYDTFNLSKISSPSLITGTADALFIFDPKKGVYKADSDSVDLIIPFDKEWKRVVDIKTFNSNVYLLDTGADEIYKYTPIEGGYSDKLSYFRGGQSIDLSNAENISIDFSVFILTTNALFKYTGGLRDDFSVKDENIIEGARAVYKNSETEDIYVMDPSHQRIVVLSEEGETKKSYYNPRIKEAVSFGMHPEKGVLFLEKDTIYLLDKTQQ